MFKLRIKKFHKYIIFLVFFSFLDIMGGLLFFQNVTFENSGLNNPATQAGFVFFGGANSSFTDMNQESLRRVNYALELYRRGLVENLVCLGGAYHSNNFSGSKTMKDYLSRKGVAEEHLFTESRSYDSYSNWESACDIIHKNNWQKVTLIASPLHISRLRRMIPPMSCQAQIYCAPYDYSKQNPRISFRLIWYQVHYEWAAYLADFLLPQDIHGRILKKMRQ